MPDFVTNIAGWEFMSEPLWRWFVFMGALAAITVAWNGILSLMK